MNVLLVEDEDMIALYLQKLFRKRGHKLDWAADGEQGLDLAQTASKAYDAIILDIVLPKMSGLEICRTLRADDQHTPILILSSKDSESERVAGLDVGADDYMVKPFSGEELLARLRALTRRPNKVLQPVLEIEGISLDPARREVICNSEVLHLRPKEYSILEMLLRSRGEVSNREDMLHKIWGIRRNNASNRLDVSVRHLRSKLEAACGIDPIKTVRGVGYMIE